MILAIDIGNTNIVVGGIDDEKIHFVARLSTDRTKTEDEYAVIFKNILEIHHISAAVFDGAIISSVVPPLINILKRSVKMLTELTPLVVGPGIKTGLNIKIDNPSQLGSDLVVGAVAAVTLYPKPLIIFDMGTATTICAIDKNGNYLGGIIYPGVKVSLDSLTQRTSQLPAISLDAPAKAIGKNTIDCMKSGIIYGNAAMADGMIDRFENELGEKATILATGGLAQTILPHCKHKIILDDDLLIKGLKIIYDKNKPSFNS